jgi:hypothetical protein
MSKSIVFTTKLWKSQIVINITHSVLVTRSNTRHLYARVHTGALSVRHMQRLVRSGKRGYARVFNDNSEKSPVCRGISNHLGIIY